MGEFANWYNSIKGDRKYDADSFSEWLRPFFKTGVFNGELQVVSNTDMSISIKPGNVNIGGKTKLFENIQTITVEAPHAALKRIDNIVIRRNDIERDFSVMIQKGMFSEEPSAQTPVRSAGIYDLVIAQIYVGASIVKILPENITDTRMNSSLCGWVVSNVEEIDFDQISVQWQAFIKNFKEINEKEFDDWFANIKDKLSEDIAGSLQNQIDDNVKKIEGNEVLINGIKEMLIIDKGIITVSINSVWTQLTTATATAEELENDPSLEFSWYTDFVYNCLETDDIDLRPNIPTGNLGLAPSAKTLNGKIRFYAGANLSGSELKFMHSTKRRGNTV